MWYLAIQKEVLIITTSHVFMMAEIKALQSNLTLEEIHAKQAKLESEVGNAEMKFMGSQPVIWKNHP